VPTKSLSSSGLLTDPPKEEKISLFFVCTTDLEQTLTTCEVCLSTLLFSTRERWDIKRLVLRRMKERYKQGTHQEHSARNLPLNFLNRD
jgi:hypothetical protein